MNTITIFYFVNSNSSIYKSKTMTTKKFKDLVSKGHKDTKDIAFILKGVHADKSSHELSAYLEKYNLEKLSKWDIK